MITESKITEIFCVADDFSIEFEVEMAKENLADDQYVFQIYTNPFKHIQPHITISRPQTLTDFNYISAIKVW